MATAQSEQATLRDESDMDGDKITRPYESDIDQEKAGFDKSPNDFSGDGEKTDQDEGQTTDAPQAETAEDKAPPAPPGPPMMPGGPPPDGGLQAWMQVAGAFM